MIAEDAVELRTWLERQCRQRNKVALHRAVVGWRQVLGDVLRGGYAPGPLMPERVYVDHRGELRLGEADGPINGHACLHAGRRSDDDPSSLAFSGMYILVALRALSLHPEWWEERVQHAGEHQLLISHDDLYKNALSDLGGQLVETEDEVLRDWAVKLFGLHEQDQDQPISPDDLLDFHSELPPPPRFSDPPVVEADLVERLSWAMDSGEASWFLEWFDAAEIRRLRFPHERQLQLRRWVEEHLADNRVVDEYVNSGLDDHRERLNVAPREIILSGFAPPRGDRTGYDIAWAWPHPRFADDCLVVLSREAPARPNLTRVDLNRIDPRELGPGVVDARLWPWDNGQPNSVLHVQPEHVGTIVSVWSLIDLRFTRFCSGPLVLGEIQPPRPPQPWYARWRRRRRASKPKPAR